MNKHLSVILPVVLIALMATLALTNLARHFGRDAQTVERSQELLATGATRIATACPFCFVMIDDGVKGEGVEESEVKVGDIALHVLEAIEAGDA